MVTPIGDPPLSPEVERQLAEILRQLSVAAPSAVGFMRFFGRSLRLGPLAAVLLSLTQIAARDNPLPILTREKELLLGVAPTTYVPETAPLAEEMAVDRDEALRLLDEAWIRISLAEIRLAELGVTLPIGVPLGPWPDLEALNEVLRELQAQVDAFVLPPEELETWTREVYIPQREIFVSPTPIEAPVFAPREDEPFEPTPAPEPEPEPAPAPAPGPLPTPTPISATDAMTLAAPLLAGLTPVITEISTAVKNTHRERQTCVASTSRTIINALAGIAGVVGLPLALLSTDQGRAIVDRVVGVAWDSVFNEAIVPRPADPDRALEAARTLFAEKAALGAAAHLLAVTAETNANLKHMGFGFLAAFLADLAGFQRVANATMGEVEFAALTLPMRHKVQRDYRPQLPLLSDIGEAYAKKEIAPGPIPEGSPPRAGFTEADPDSPTTNLYEALARSGIRDEWIRVFSHHLFRDPRMFELVRIGQFFNPQLDERSAGATQFMREWIDARPWLLEEIGITREEWDEVPWFYFKASVGGYEPADTRVIVETALRAVVRREQTLALDAITRLFRDGFITVERLQELTEEVWGLRPGPDGTFTFRGNPVTARVRATQLRTLSTQLADELEVALRARSRGLLTDQEVIDGLLALGMPLERVQDALRREKLGLVPRTRLAVAATLEDLPPRGDGGDEDE